MRIAFLCVCMDPGKDGVGDYVRKLAGELVRQGQECSVVALSDNGVTEVVSERQGGASGEMQVLRLPQGMVEEERLKRAERWIDEVDPDWVSLQFVIFAFHGKGLPFGLHKRLKKVIGRRKLHLMFHETWVGFTRRSTVKHLLWGKLQKGILQRLVKSLCPAVVHTSNRLYQEVLERGEIAAEVLPLFSNIPVIPRGVDSVAIKLQALGIDEQNRQEWVLLGIFGIIHPGYDLTAFLSELLKRSEFQQKKVALLGAGRAGDEQETFWKAHQKTLGDRVLFHHFGEQSEKEISHFLQSLDYGIAVLPSFLLGKSGSYAAMRAHGLEVLVPFEIRLEDFPSHVNTGDLLHSYQVADTAALFLGALGGCPGS